MTMPDERTLALLYAGELLTDLLDAVKTPGVPDSVRERARRVLRHYPARHDIAIIAEHDVCGALIDPMLDDAGARKFPN